jgi:hypothetical protein
MTAFDSKSAATTRRTWRWLFALAFGFVLAACSAVKLGYNNADTLLVYSLDSYFDLSSEQDALARDRVAALLAWHRATQLSDYAQLIGEARARIDGRAGGEVSGDEVIAFNRALNARLIAVGNKAAPDVARLALTLTPAQIDRFAGKLADDTSKARRELIRFAGKQTPEERAEKYADNVKFWFGSVNERQAALLRDMLANRPSTATFWIEERERRQAGLVALLRKIQAERPDLALATTWVRGYFAELAEPADPARRAKLEEFRRATAALIARLIDASTPAQRAALSNKLAGFADDFVALAMERNGSG